MIELLSKDYLILELTSLKDTLLELLVLDTLALRPRVTKPLDKELRRVGTIV
jgi:hypothetical protein